MKGLILKDLYNISHNAKSMFFILLFFAVVFLPSSGTQGYMFTCTLLCTMMIVTTFTFDEFSNWTPYALIMPVSRENLVAGKYIVLVIFSAAGTLFGLLAGLIGTRIAGNFRACRHSSPRPYRHRFPGCFHYMRRHVHPPDISVRPGKRKAACTGFLLYSFHYMLYSLSFAPNFGDCAHR